VFSGVVTNAGTAETAPVVEVTGPTPATWFVSNVTQGKTLRVNYAVPAGQLLAIDLATRRVTLAGVAVSGAVDLATTRWWTLDAGANTVQASVAATVRHHDAYR
jgi:phage-related protein